MALNARLALVAERAASFYREHGRTFPWRTELDCYRLALAEILLQKTRAQSALPIYEILCDSYPTAQALATAVIGEVEAVLRPLGLSRRRALQLRGMAEAILRLGAPATADWRVIMAEVPGLGAYSARAISCFGWGSPVGIVDANVARIVRRVFRVVPRDPRAVIYQRYADELADAASDPRATNFGLLDIGAAVCRPTPICGRCPFASFCPRYDIGTRDSQPTAKGNAKKG
jgi:A/G-specific adenine glycosylase